VIFGPRSRKAALVVHVLASVGWFGAVLATVVLAIVALRARERAAIVNSYVALRQVAVYALVPLAMASLLSGVVQSLGTTWGLFRHYWVVVKLTLNVAASVVLLLYLETLRELAAPLPDAPVATLRDPSPLVHGLGALLLLACAAVLSVFKPRGLTRHGQRAEVRARR
jgi:hypothetical protein